MKNEQTKPYAAVVYVKEDTKQVVVHFSGLRTVNEADLFSVYLVEELDLHHLQAPKTVTLH